MDNIMTQILQAQAQASGEASVETPSSTGSINNQVDGPPMGLSPPNPFAEAEAALNQQWTMLSQHLQMLNVGMDSEIFASVIHKTMDMLNQASSNFSALQKNMDNLIGTYAAATPQLEPLQPETLISTVDSLLNKNLDYVNQAHSGINHGLTIPAPKPMPDLTMSPLVE
jgi:hypothetical protein